MEITTVIQHILAAAQSFGSQDYYSKSRMMILELAGVFCENEQNVDKMNHRLFERKYLGKLGMQPKVRE